jgi:hypothetical protein
LIRFKETNKQNSKAKFDPIINLNGQTTNQRLDWDAELLNVLLTKQKPELLSSQPVQFDEEICGTRYLKYQSIYNTGSIPGKKQLFPDKKQQAQQICLIFL